MPTYAYACTQCGHRFEAVQSFSDAALTECPECAGRLRKVFSPVGVVFKGSGFYRTDSRKAETSPGKSDKPGTKEPAAATASPSSQPDSSGPSKAATANPSSSTTGTTSAA